jgi:hypothetical protein
MKVKDKDTIGRIAFEQKYGKGGIDWTKTFDEFLAEISSKKERRYGVTTITLENEYGACTIKVHKNDMTITEVIEDLFVPAMNGMGYVIEYGSIHHSEKE